MRKNIQITRALKEVGEAVRTARIRRRLPQRIVAERAGVSLRTVAKFEQGDPGISLGNVAAMLNAVGLLPILLQTADPRNDPYGCLLEEMRMPCRVRLPGEKTNASKAKD